MQEAHDPVIGLVEGLQRHVDGRRFLDEARAVEKPRSDDVQPGAAIPADDVGERDIAGNEIAEAVTELRRAGIDRQHDDPVMRGERAAESLRELRPVAAALEPADEDAPAAALRQRLRQARDQRVEVEAGVIGVRRRRRQCRPDVRGRRLRLPYSGELMQPPRPL